MEQKTVKKAQIEPPIRRRKTQNFFCVSTKRMPVPTVVPEDKFFGGHIIVQPDEHTKDQVAITRAYQCLDRDRSWHGSTLRLSNKEAFAVMEALVKFFLTKKQDKIVVWCPTPADMNRMKESLKDLEKGS